MSGLPVREVAAAIIVHRGRVLVQTRPEGTRWEGFWEFPGGGREAGETPAAAAERECVEELGLVVRATETYQEVEWSYPRVRVHVTFLLCEAVEAGDGWPEPEPRLGQQLRWADADELARMRFLPANAGVLVHLRQRLARSRPGPTPS